MSSRNIKNVKSSGHGDKLNVGGEIGIRDSGMGEVFPTYIESIRGRTDLGEKMMGSVLHRGA